MPARTFTSAGVDNFWNNPANWDGGISAPVDNDSVTIPLGQTCEYNDDMSNPVIWPNGIAGITITGTLKLTRAAGGPYYLKIKAATTITGVGTFDCGASALDAIPFAVKHTITGGAAWYINGALGLTMTVFAAEPAIKTVLQTALEPIGETVIAVDTSVVGDIWADGDTIRIDDINRAQETEERVIAAGGIAAGTITITVGLTAAKSIGAVVSLITRNVKFIGVGAAGFVAQNFASGKLTVAGGQWLTANYRICNGCTDMTISGGTFTSSTYALYNCTGLTISGGVFSGNTAVTYIGNSINVSSGSFTGNQNVFLSNTGMRVSGGTFKGNGYPINTCPGSSISGGTFFGNILIFNACAGLTISGGTYSNNTNVVGASGAIIKNVSLSSVTSDISESQFICFNTVLGTAPEVTLYTRLAKEVYSESIDHDQTLGAFRAWTRGGITSSQIVTVPPGYTQANQTVLENATVEGFWQREVIVGAGASVNITMYLRKDAAMAYLPRCIIFNKAATDPFAGGAGIHTFTMTNAINVWENETYTYGNSTANDVTLVIRCQGMNAANNMFSLVAVEQINVDLTAVLAILNDIHNVDLPAVKADTAAILLDTGTTGVLLDPAAVDAVLDETVEGAYTLRQLLRVMAAALAGRASGGGTATITFRDLNNTADRIVATVDVNGNRTNVVLTV